MFGAIFSSYNPNPNKTTWWSFTFDQLLRTETSRKAESITFRNHISIFLLPPFPFPFRPLVFSDSSLAVDLAKNGTQDSKFSTLNFDLFAFTFPLPLFINHLFMQNPPWPSYLELWKVEVRILTFSQPNLDLSASSFLLLLLFEPLIYVEVILSHWSEIESRPFM